MAPNFTAEDKLTAITHRHTISPFSKTVAQNACTV